MLCKREEIPGIVGRLRREGHCGYSDQDLTPTNCNQMPVHFCGIHLYKFQHEAGLKNVSSLYLLPMRKQL